MTADLRESRPRKRKKRLPVSCEECRIRKEKCDRNVPGCSNCRKRETTCKWGDYRDGPEGATVEQSSLEVINGAVGDGRDAQSDTLIARTIEDTANAITRYASGETPYVPTQGGRDHLNEDLVKRSRKLLPPLQPVKHITRIFLDFPQHLYYCIDVDNFDDLLRSTYDENRHESTAVSLSLSASIGDLAQLHLVLAASLQQTQSLYLVALGLVSSVDDIQYQAREHLELGLACLDACLMGNAPLSLAPLQGAAIYAVWLSDRTSATHYASILDQCMRSGAMLGLDRLASMSWDQRWLQENGSVFLDQDRPQSSLWSAQKLWEGDLQARELGRAVWYTFILLKGINPATMLIDDELATAYPGETPSTLEYSPFDIWQGIKRLTPFIQDWKRLKAQAEAMGTMPSYEAQHNVYLRLQNAVDEFAPASHLTQCFTSETGHATRANKFTSPEIMKKAQSAWISLLFQLKMLMMQRPLMGAGYHNNQIHGHSIQIALQCAHDILKGAQCFKKNGWCHFGSIFGKNAVLQASLAILLDLFHRPIHLDTNAGQEKYQHLLIAVEILKAGEDERHPSSNAYKAGSKIESLIAACSRHCSFLLSPQQTESSISDETILTPGSSLQEATWLDDLDWHLFQAAYGPAANTRTDMDQVIWPKTANSNGDNQSQQQPGGNVSGTDIPFDDLWNEIMKTIEYH